MPQKAARNVLKGRAVLPSSDEAKSDSPSCMEQWRCHLFPQEYRTQKKQRKKIPDFINKPGRIEKLFRHQRKNQRQHPDIPDAASAVCGHMPAEDGSKKQHQAQKTGEHNITQKKMNGKGQSISPPPSLESIRRCISSRSSSDNSEPDKREDSSAEA